MRISNLIVSAAALAALALSPACKKDETKKEPTANPCADKNPCAAKDPCAGKTAPNPCAAKNPCNPCAAKNPCNPCAAKNPCGEPAADKLFDRLGGQEAITAVVDDFVGNVIGDKRINAFFAKADGAKLKEHLVNQICEATGGPCKYTGKDMKTVHKDMKITEAHFNALVEDLVKALDKHKVPEAEKTELLTALGGMKDDIVTVKE